MKLLHLCYDCLISYKVSYNFHLQHVVKATSAGYISGLRVSAGQQVSDGTVLFSVEVSCACFLLLLGEPIFS